MIVVVMGVAGSGKSTVGAMLADAMHCPFLDGDSLHSAANVGKMMRGVPLTDADRALWLAAIHARLLKAFRSGRSLVVGCSALRNRNSGTGRWTVKYALAQGIPVPGISIALCEPFDSRVQKRFAHQVIAALRKQFGGHAVRER
jgi:carbohydrate kinase (thermoresistant glucokinase family)